MRDRDESGAQHAQPGDLVIGQVAEGLLLDGVGLADARYPQLVPDPGADADLAFLHRLDPLDHVAGHEPGAEEDLVDERVRGSGFPDAAGGQSPEVHLAGEQRPQRGGVLRGQRRGEPVRQTAR